MSADEREIVELGREDAAARDGIGEEDHRIPLWFNASFGGTIVFAIVYVLYHSFSGWSQKSQYEAELALAATRAERVRAERPAENPYRGDPAAIAEGAQVFATICAGFGPFTVSEPSSHDRISA